jgi:hypothetical protein
VTNDYLSPNKSYNQIDYSNFGVPIEIKDYDPKEKGQCAKGIHVIPIVENADFSNCLYGRKCIVLEVDESDIIYQENNGKMRVRKATPIGDFDRNHSMWNTMIKNPEFAYLYAIFIDKCAKDDTRDVVLSNPYYAYNYANDVDKCPRDDTRNAVLSNHVFAYSYAINVDKCVREDTRNAVLSDPLYAYFYARDVDQCAREDTRNAVLSNPEYTYLYAREVDECARNDTRNAAYKDIYCKELYIEEFGE